MFLTYLLFILTVCLGFRCVCVFVVCWLNCLFVNIFNYCFEFAVGCLECCVCSLIWFDFWMLFYCMSVFLFVFVLMSFCCVKYGGVLLLANSFYFWFLLYLIPFGFCVYATCLDVVILLVFVDLYFGIDFIVLLLLGCLLVFCFFAVVVLVWFTLIVWVLYWFVLCECFADLFVLLYYLLVWFDLVYWFVCMLDFVGALNCELFCLD